MDDVSRRIREFLATQVLFEADPGTFKEKTELVPNLVDSLGLMQLVTYAEEEFGITFEDSEVVPESFETLGDMERLVRDKVALARAATG